MKSASILSRLMALTLFSSISCADQHSSLQNLQQANVYNGNSTHIQMVAQDTVTVVNQDMNPVAGASVLLGFEVGDPFKGNQLITDVNGVVTVPTDWKSNLPITVEAAGYVTATIPTATPGATKIRINRKVGNQEIEIKGINTGFGRLKTDGKIDFGLVIPALSREKMLSFDIGTVISPKSDTVTVIGNDVNIPTNITLPKQSETYVFPITLDKPIYRMYVRDPGNYTLFSSHGQFPLQKVVDDIRAGKSMFEVINYFSFFSGGQQDVAVNSNMTGIDLPVDQIEFKDKVSVKAPSIANNEVMISLALMENNGLLMPTDMKRLKSGEIMNLNSTGTTPSVVSVLLEENKKATSSLMSVQSVSPLSVFEQYFSQYAIQAGGLAAPAPAQDFNRLSLTFQSGVGGVSPQFLGLTDKPSYANNTLKMVTPKMPTGLTEVATYMVLSEIEIIKSSATTETERRTPVWEVWSTGWSNQVELPKLVVNQNPDRKYRWEVMFLARPSNFLPTSIEASSSNIIDLNTVTHISRNALDI